MRRPLFNLALVTCAITVAGCASALKNAHGTALSGVDLVSMTDDMAGRIGSDPQINAAFARNGPLKIVVMPVVNELQAEVIPSGQAYAFTGRLRALLAKHAPERFTWIMNRDAFNDLQRRERDLQIDPGPSPDRVQPEFALTATFSSLTNENKDRRDSFYVCSFSLTDLRDRSILWNGTYDLKKQAVRGFLD
jgi:hypothetical protein